MSGLLVSSDETRPTWPVVGNVDLQLAMVQPQREVHGAGT